MTPRITVTSDLGAAAGSTLRQAIDAAIRERGRARLAIPGGRSPTPVFAWLAAHLSPQTVAHLVVTWVDERHLPNADPEGPWPDLPAESNLRGAWGQWFSVARAVPRLVPLVHPGTLRQARAAVASRFDAELGGLDVVLLGAGPDGHVASLFPGHPALEDPGPVIAVDDSPKPPRERLTLSLPVLASAACVVLVAAGADRAPMLARAAAGDHHLPLGRLAPRGQWHWVLDDAAAADLHLR